MRSPAQLARFLLVAALALPSALAAETLTYVLDQDASTVTFETDFGPDLITGTIPLESADLKLDVDAIARSSITVVLDVSGATASFPFAAQALKGPKVLAAKDHPTIGFVSSAIRRAGDEAEVTGALTIRGVTRDVTLQARISRPPGSSPDDLSRLTVRLTGRVNRSDFGATGWADMVGDEVRILITARIDAEG
ncbi:MAG: YceI family protein [Tabrizicola sp.]|nr:YceI family protein [Tabrizicola sp.]